MCHDLRDDGPEVDEAIALHDFLQRLAIQVDQGIAFICGGGNTQAAVDAETFFVVGQLVTDAPTDKQQLIPALESIPEEVAASENVLADTGCYGDEAIVKPEADGGSRAGSV